MSDKDIERYGQAVYKKEINTSGPKIFVLSAVTMLTLCIVTAERTKKGKAEVFSVSHEGTSEGLNQPS